MKWKQIAITTITDAEDVIISALCDIGLEGAQIQDKIPLTTQEKEQMFVDILPEIEVDDGVAILTFYIEEEKIQVNGEKATIAELILKIQEELEQIATFMNIGAGLIEVTETEDKDWINNWKEFFHQFTIEDLLIIPSWEKIQEEDKNKKILHIDPGSAFGTGLHETTQLCIRQLKKYVTPSTILLDVGCGSGILGIVALLFGAKLAKGTDLDPCAIEATTENLAVNEIESERFEVQIGNIITEREVSDSLGYEKYDIVVANILAEVLIPLTPIVMNQLKKGGIYITSGIIDDKEQAVLNVIKAAGMTIEEVTYQGEWVSITARK